MPYIDIARPSTWTKNIFILPGVCLAYFFNPSALGLHSIKGVMLAFLATCIVASSNYVLNEILDAPSDSHHPIKKRRPIPAGLINIGVAWMQWAFLAAAGVAIGFYVNYHTGMMALLLFVMGLIYNVEPIRCKDRAYLDVIIESINNPIRLALGWYGAGMTGPITLSAIVAYWMFGAFLMAIKRFAEYRYIADHAKASEYRKSFRDYSEEKLLLSSMFYACAFGISAGVFIARYSIELLIAAPFVAFAVAYYAHLGYGTNSTVQYPELLFKEKKLMLILAVVLTLSATALFLKIPMLTEFFQPLMSVAK